MASVKLRLIVNKGRHGAPLSKLGKISEQLERFLKSLAADCKIETKPGEWVAVNFANGSVEYDAQYQGDVNPGAAQVFARGLEFIADYDPDREGLNGLVSAATAMEYARIGSLIDPDEDIGLGIYPILGGPPKWRSITYGRMASIRREIETPLASYGAIQGILYAWFKEAQEPSFQVREMGTDALVRVRYPATLYSDVAKAVQERTTTLIVSGDMTFDRTTRLPLEVKAERIERIGMLAASEFEKLIGSSPDYEADFSDDSCYEVTA